MYRFNTNFPSFGRDRLNKSGSSLVRGSVCLERKCAGQVISPVLVSAFGKYETGSTDYRVFHPYRGPCGVTAFQLITA